MLITEAAMALLAALLAAHYALRCQRAYGARRTELEHMPLHPQKCAEKCLVCARPAKALYTCGHALHDACTLGACPCGGGKRRRNARQRSTTPPRRWEHSVRALRQTRLQQEFPVHWAMQQLAAALRALWKGAAPLVVQQ